MSLARRSAGLLAGATWALFACGGSVAETELKGPVNRPPSITKARIEPDEYRTDSVIQVAPEGWDDLDGDKPGYKYRWLVNGREVAGQTGDTLDGANFDKGDSVLAEVIPFDGKAEGEPVRSNDVVVANTPPVLTSVTLSPSVADTSTVLEAVVGDATDADGDSVTVYFEWTINGNVYPGSIAGLLDGGAFDAFERGDVVSVAAFPSDGDDNGDSVVSGPVSIGNARPVISDVTVAYKPAYYSDDVLSAAVGSSLDADGDPVTFHYEWRVNGALAATSATLDGAQWFSRGDTVSVVIVPYDGMGGYGMPAASPGVAIVNKAPVVAAASLGAGPYYTNDTLALTTLTWYDADGDPEQYDFQWHKGGSPLAGATAPTLPGSAFVKGDVMAVRVTPRDGDGAGAAVLSNTVTIANSPPSLAAVTTAAGPFYGSDPIVAYPGGFFDADGDSPVYRYQWYVNNLPVSTAKTLPASAHVRGDSVRVTAWPRDGCCVFAEGLPVTSSTLTIANATPSITSASLGSGPFYTGSVLSASYAGWSDADGDPAQATYQWFVNGALVAGAIGSSLDGAVYFSRDNTVAVAVRPFDGLMEGDARVATVTIANSAPTLPAVTLLPAYPVTTGTLYTAVTSASDADGDPVTLQYHWYLNGVLQGYPPGQTAVTPLVKGDRWGVSAQSSDGTSSSSFTAVKQTVIPFEAAQVAANGASTCALTAEGRVFCWGSNAYGKLGLGFAGGIFSSLQELSGFAGAVSSIALGNEHACAVTSGGGVSCWGRNHAGQLGNNTTGDASAPAAVTDLTSGVVSLALGNGHSCALRNTGAVSCWGDNAYGQIGDGTGNNTRLRPTPVTGLAASAVRIVAGDGFSCALLVTGEVQCWGKNTVGQLGNNFNSGGCAAFQMCNSSPVYAASFGVPITGVTDLAAGGSHACVVQSDGDVRCWGDNYIFQLGRCCGIDYSRNVLYVTTGFSRVSAGYDFTCAVRTTGGVECWGRDDVNQTGSAPTTCSGQWCRIYPTPVVDLTSGVDNIASGSNAGHTCALLADQNRLRCWGRPTSGQLGHGSTSTPGMEPVNVVGFGGAFP